MSIGFRLTQAGDIHLPGTDNKILALQHKIVNQKISMKSSLSYYKIKFYYMAFNLCILIPKCFPFYQDYIQNLWDMSTWGISQHQSAH